jgi:hypothetical protein
MELRGAYADLTTELRLRTEDVGAGRISEWVGALRWSNDGPLLDICSHSETRPTKRLP